jgi:hypothetical protein
MAETYTDKATEAAKRVVLDSLNNIGMLDVIYISDEFELTWDEEDDTMTHVRNIVDKLKDSI